jgi:protein-tyrosine phosphatase
MNIYWVESSAPKSMAIVARPRGNGSLEDELLAMRREGIDVLVSLLTTAEQQDLGLSLEGETCEKVGIEYVNFPITDHGLPASLPEFGLLVKQLQKKLDGGKHVGAHCFACIGRSSVLMASLMCAQGISAHDAFMRLGAARGFPVPETLQQMKWVEQFARSLEK